MTKTNWKSVDEYIASQPKAAQDALKRVRVAIQKAVPNAEEAISYQMPTYKVEGSRILQFAAWEQHYALYAATDRIVAVFKEELAPYSIKKGTIQFPYSEAVPVKLIEGIAKFRAKEVAAREMEGLRVKK